MKAIGYARVSTEDQAREGVSLEHQRAKIEAYARVKDLELAGIIEDAGLSAKDLRRPGMQELLRIAKARQVQAIIVFKLDRMFRSTIDALETTSQLDRLGIAFHSIQETLDTQSAMGRFFFTLTAGLAEMERGIISERTRAALQHQKAQGRVVGEVPYGFRRAGRELKPLKVEQTVIARILRWKKDGWNYSRIARRLNEQAVPTKKGCMWYSQTVKNVCQFMNKG